jgi:hypothetical protein
MIIAFSGRKAEGKEEWIPPSKAAGKALLCPFPAQKSLIRSLHCYHPDFSTGVPDKGGACRVPSAL